MKEDEARSEWLNQIEGTLARRHSRVRNARRFAAEVRSWARDGEVGKKLENLRSQAESNGLDMLADAAGEALGLLGQAADAELSALVSKHLDLVDSDRKKPPPFRKGEPNVRQSEPRDLT